MESTIIINAVIGALAALFIAVMVWYSKRPAGTTDIKWPGVIAYAAVGACVGFYGGYSGIPITMEWVGVQLVLYAGAIGLIDMALAGYFKTPSQSFMLKYTGHTYYPKFTLKLKDGTIQTFNTATTGRCCAVGVAMQQKTQEWSPGFKVTPAFIDGQSPFTVALDITTGRDADLTALEFVEVDWLDGATPEQIPMKIGKEGNPVGVATHTYRFFGN